MSSTEADWSEHLLTLRAKLLLQTDYQVGSKLITKLAANGVTDELRGSGPSEAIFYHGALRSLVPWLIFL